MIPGQVAHADQILAVLRDADEPLTMAQVYRLTRRSWSRVSFLDTCRTVWELSHRGVIVGTGCCEIHASWSLPEDR